MFTLKPSQKSIWLCVTAAVMASLSACKKSDTVKPATADAGHSTDKVYQTANIAVPASGLIAYWSFDNNGNDLSGNENHGVLNNVSSATDRFGNSLGAYHFDGKTSYIKVDDKPSLRLNNTDFTVNLWVNMDSYKVNTNGYNPLSKRISGFNNGWSNSIAGTVGMAPLGVATFGPGGGQTHAIGTKKVPIRNWHMITYTYNYGTSRLSIYIDGRLDNVTPNFPSPAANITAPLYIGRDNPELPTDYTYKGSLDDVSIYNSEFSASSVAKLYSATASRPSPNLIAYWPFDNSADDLSGNWNNGKAYNLYSATDRFGNKTGAYRFDGTNTYIEVPDNTELRLSYTDFTLNAWVNINDYNSSLGSLLLSKNKGPGNGWLWGIAGKNVISPFVVGSVNYGLGSTGKYVRGSAPVALNQWHMVTTVYAFSAQQTSIYVDGVLDRVINGVHTTNPTTASALYIGRNDTDVSGNNYQGAMDEVSIYNSALSLSSIQQLYTATH